MRDKPEAWVVTHRCLNLCRCRAISSRYFKTLCAARVIPVGICLAPHECLVRQLPEVCTRCAPASPCANQRLLSPSAACAAAAWMLLVQERHFEVDARQRWAFAWSIDIQGSSVTLPRLHVAPWSTSIPMLDKLCRFSRTTWRQRQLTQLAAAGSQR